MREKVYAYMAGICRNKDSFAKAIGGMEDHVHVLCNLSKNIAAAKLIQHIKQDSSKWIKTQWPGLNYFYWQHGYGIFSVSPDRVHRVTNYINNQEEHHRNVGYQEEVLSLLEESGMEYDEQFLWG
jgi:REP element-mobilizing transposase RayT